MFPSTFDMAKKACQSVKNELYTPTGKEVYGDEISNKPSSGLAWNPQIFATPLLLNGRVVAVRVTERTHIGTETHTLSTNE